MPDWFDQHAPDTSSTPSADVRPSWWERVKGTRLGDMGRAFIDDLPGIVKTATTPLTTIGSRATHAAAGVMERHPGVLDAVVGAPTRVTMERNLEDLGGQLDAYSSPLGIGMMAAGPLAKAAAPLVGESKGLGALGALFEGDTERPLDRALRTWPKDPGLQPLPTPAQPELNAPGGYAGEPGAPISRLEQVFGIEPDRAGLPAKMAEEPAWPVADVPRTTGTPIVATPGVEGQPVSRLEQVLGLEPDRITPGGRGWAGAPEGEPQSLPLEGTREQPDLLSAPAEPAVGTNARPGAADLQIEGAGDWFDQHAPEPAAAEAPAVHDQVGEAEPAPVDIGEPSSLDEVLRILHGESPRDEAGIYTASPEGEPAPPIAPEPGKMPEPALDAPVGASEPAPVDTAPSPGSPIHPLQKLYDTLKPKWQGALDRGEELPFVGEPGRMEDFPEFYQRVVGEPTSRFGAERKVMRPFDEAYEAAHGATAETPDLAGEAGFVDPQALAAGADTALRKLPDAINAPRYFSMLSGPTTQAKNVMGNLGSLGLKSLERLLEGDVKGAINIGRETFSGDTLRSLKEAWKNPDMVEGRWGPINGVLGVPGRAMGAVDQATREILDRAGIPDEEALLATFRNEPRSTLGQWLQSGTKKSSLLRLGTPFTKTATNIVERGLERTPGVGLLPWVRDMAPASGRALAVRQALGTAAVGGGYALAKHESLDRKAGRPTISGGKGMGSGLAMSALAALALPASMGIEIEQALEKPRKRPNESGGSAMIDRTLQAGEAAGSAFKRAAPSIADAYDYDPANILATFVPGALRDLSPVSPSALDATRPRSRNVPSVLGPAISRIPFFNDMLLYRKPKPPASAPTLGSVVGDWFDANAPQ